MSGTAPEAPARPAASPARGGGNVFTRKLGPLPMWVWLLISAAVVLGYAYWKNRQQAAQATTQTATGTDASQVPQFVNQTYTTVIPPLTPGPPPPGPRGPAGPPGKAGPAGRPPGPPFVYGKSGKPIGEYLTGAAEVAYIKANVGRYGITRREANDVAAFYQKTVKTHGKAAAESYHYTWNGPGKIMIVPVGAPGSTGFG